MAATQDQIARALLALEAARIREEEALLMTGDELVDAIGAEATYDLVVTLETQNKTIAHSPGSPGRRAPDRALRARNIEIVRLRLVEKMNYTAIGRAVGVSKTRVVQLLHDHFGLDSTRVRRTSIVIPAQALAVACTAVRHQFAAAAEDVAACLRSDDDTSDELRNFDIARGLLHDLKGEDAVEIHLARKRGPVLARALRKQLAIERGLADTSDPCQRERHAGDAATLDRLLSAIVP
ncbi:MAG TPA: hypothetical protein VGX26_10945 [Solirubrobacteraceae bacterium]|jgi:hypothetical protein|nr:hypothetical protein [Solirubrobacteraceae bacterium]